MSTPSRTLIRLTVFVQPARMTDRMTDIPRYGIIDSNRLHLVYTMPAEKLKSDAAGSLLRRIVVSDNELLSCTLVHLVN